MILLLAGMWGIVVAFFRDFVVLLFRSFVILLTAKSAEDAFLMVNY